MAGQSNILIDKIKLYISPILLSAISYIIWTDITEMKSDVKKLVSESEYRRGKEEQMEKDISELKNAVYITKKSISASDINKKKEKTERRLPTYFINERMFVYKKENMVV